MQSDMIVLGNADQAKNWWNQREVLLFCRGAKGRGWGSAVEVSRFLYPESLLLQLPQKLCRNGTCEGGRGDSNNSSSSSDKRDQLGQLLWQNSIAL
ncbi:hypothetical protein BTVI_84770 [Pitangus sulphuratus]|nr:hypothetical protein BTVI_84770 [Pitangus sulphuratus]